VTRGSTGRASPGVRVEAAQLVIDASRSISQVAKEAGVAAHVSVRRAAGARGS
jgi:transposase-like protein